MAYIPANDSSDGAKVVYESKDGKTSKTFDALDWLAQLITHIPKKANKWSDMEFIRFGGAITRISPEDYEKKPVLTMTCRH
ncbi:MAG: hypothetical protein JRI77_16155 [Deltaproteobacteria bacterium]|nr:hypothetical protein [Deltaproteobacteria bacterium]